MQIGECAIPLAMSNYIMEYYHESRFKLHKTLMNSEKDSISVMFVPVALHERLMGFLIIVQTVTELEKVNYSVLETSMRILGIHLLEEKLQADSRAFSQDSFLNSVLMNQYSNDAMIRYNCDIWGFDYLMNRICVYVEIDNYLNLPYFKRNRIGDVFNNIKRRVVQEYGMKEYSMPFREGYILFFLFSADLENVEIRDMAIKAVNMFVQEMEKEKCSIHIGISSVGKRLQHISEAFKQSVDILALGRKLYPDRTEYFYQDLLAYHFLYNSLTIEKLVSIYNDTVAVVDEYDQKNNTDLLETLDIYLENDCNTSKAAEQLHLHRNTMMYRLEKIQDILQTEITGSDHNFNIRLGIRAKKIMNLYKINNKTVQSNE